MFYLSPDARQSTLAKRTRRNELRVPFIVEIGSNEYTHRYNEALAAQPTHPTLLSPLIRYSAIPLFVTGNVLVLTSMWALGVTGTYLGDYFGIRKSYSYIPYCLAYSLVRLTRALT